MASAATHCNNARMTPHEIAIGGVYFPPLLFSAVLGTLAAWAVATLLNRLDLSRYFFYPPLVFLAMAVIFTALISRHLIPG